MYVHHADAVAAIERYNNQRLDGKQMEIKLVGLHVVAPVPVPPNKTFLQEKPNLVFQRYVFSFFLFLCWVYDLSVYYFFAIRDRTLGLSIRLS